MTITFAIECTVAFEVGRGWASGDIVEQARSPRKGAAIIYTALVSPLRKG